MILINMSLPLIVSSRSSWSWPSTTMLTLPRCWRAHCGGRPNAYTIMSRLTSDSRGPFITKQCRSWLSLSCASSRRQDWHRALGQNISRQLYKSKVGDRRMALRGQSGHLSGQIVYQHGTGQDGGHWQCQEKGVKFSWQSFVYLVKLPRAKNTSHLSRSWVVEKASYPFRSASQQVFLVTINIYLWNINFLFVHPPHTSSWMLLCSSV